MEVGTTHPDLLSIRELLRLLEEAIPPPLPWLLPLRKLSELGKERLITTQTHNGNGYITNNNNITGPRLQDKRSGRHYRGGSKRVGKDVLFSFFKENRWYGMEKGVRSLFRTSFIHSKCEIVQRKFELVQWRRNLFLTGKGK